MRTIMLGLAVMVAVGTGAGVVTVACINPAGDCREIDTCCPDGTMGCFLTTTDGGDGGDGGTDGGDSGPPPSCIPSENTVAVADSCGVFVSSSNGSDTTGKGTKGQPYQTLGTALMKANGQPVYACGETFTEAVTVSVGVMLYGALVCSQSWMYDATQKTQLTAVADAVPLTLASTAGGTVVHDFAISAVDGVAEAGSTAGSSIAVLVQASVAFENVDVTAGKGAAGAAGAMQMAVMTPAGAAGSVGGDDTACTNMMGVFGGAGGTNTCSGMDTEGGSGGAGQKAGSGGNGNPGTPTTHMNGGTGETATMTCQPGGNGVPGNPGMAGTGARGIGDVSSTGYAGATATPGGAGSPGQGGGGGGGAYECGMPGMYAAGASGGGGGAGDCGGAAGNFGLSGGSSIGILALGATPLLTNVSITTHDGGIGGTGGDGQKGGAGGMPGNPGGNGACAGGSGGPGGAGGPGGGGAGGHSAAIALKGTGLPELSSIKVTHGNGAAGGPGGNGQMTMQVTGDAGLGCKTLDFTNPLSMTACVM